MRRNKAFTLVEILIVVVILGILAAIVVPQFANATKDSQAGNLKSQIKSIENQLELHRARVGSYPTVAQLNLTTFTDPVSGNTANSPAGWAYMIAKGHVKAAPYNPSISRDQADPTVGASVGAGTKQTDGNVDGDGTNAWAYDEATGDFGALNFDEAQGTIRTGL